MLVFLQGWVGTEEPAEPEASGGTSSVAKRDVRFWLLKLTKLLFFWGDFSHAFWHLQDN